MAGIGEASAILGVAQIGIQLAQTLVTVIGDFRDAAVNINRLRDEIHLTSICLQQLGDLAKEGRLIAGRGVLEATNLRERCRAVIWEIRIIIQKGDNPLNPEEITKDDIDVSYFTAWKWALWTKKHLEDPRLELDRLKNSMTLTFVSHMAIQASSEHERRRYTAQIPGYRRTCDWAEQRWREDTEEPQIPNAMLQATNEDWEEYMKWKSRRDDPLLELEAIRERLAQSGMASNQVVGILGGVTVPQAKSEKYAVWSLDPFVGHVQLPVDQSWILQATATPQSPEEMWKVHSKLKPWYKKQLDELINNTGIDGSKWSIFSLKLVHKSFFRRNENPPSLQVILKGEMSPIALQQPQNRIAKAVTYSMEEPILGDEVEPLSDEELIRQQLDLYNS
jgi:hypothetical protein